MTIATTHNIERTSPKGGPFIGTCVLCGKPGLTSGQVNEFCANPNSVTQEESVMSAIKGTVSDGSKDIEFIDRYQALGIPRPDLETMCKGQCDGVGFYPTRLDDATSEEAALWNEMHRRPHSEPCDGWHFITCPDCKGTGKATL